MIPGNTPGAPVFLQAGAVLLKGGSVRVQATVAGTGLDVDPDARNGV
jgi:hypothetical protein